MRIVTVVPAVPAAASAADLVAGLQGLSNYAQQPRMPDRAHVQSCATRLILTISTADGTTFPDM